MLIFPVIIVISILFWIYNNSTTYNKIQKGGSSETTETESQETNEPESSETEQEIISGLDSTRNMQVVFPTKILNHDGFLTEWKFNAGREGIVNLQIYRPTNKSDTFVLVGENVFQVVKQGENIYEVPPMRQIPFKNGDVIGLRFQDLGIIKYVTASNDVRIETGNSSGIDVPMQFRTQSAREYSVIGITRAIPRINIKEIGGNKTYPAHSAQSIIREYSNKKLGYPLDGTYWIKTRSMKDPIEIYCDFSTRKGYGYMLIGSIAAKGGWLPIENGNFPFDPKLSFGTYDKHGRNGNYYLPWANLDPSTVVDNDPYRCRSGTFVYNQAGKFCANSKDPNSRIRLPGGLTEIMFSTANKKHWVVLDRSDLEKPINSDRKAKIKPISDSKNFESKNKKCPNVYLKGNSNETWVSMGSENGCSNYVFWGSAGSKKNLDFKDANSGIFVYVGGEHKPSTKENFRHNPSHHRAYGKNKYQSTYKEAQSVCSSMGKRICSLKQLKEANDGGFSSCSPGWTSTKASKHKYRIAYPTNINKWASLQYEPGQSNWCGKPGINEWGPLRPDEVGADIYCCDSFEWDNEFDKLDMPYRLVKEWIGKLEHQFNDSYSVEIPVGAEFIVFGEQGHGVSCKKISDTGYKLISNKNAVAHKKYPEILSQIPTGKYNLDPRTIAVFTMDLPEQNIQKHEQWPKLDSKEKIVRYGSLLQLFNSKTKQYLAGIDTKYSHKKGSNNRQVVGVSNNGTKWLVKSTRGLGKIDANGLGDDSYNFGKAIKNGKIIRLEDSYLKRNLHCDTAFSAPGLENSMKETSLFKVGAAGDSNDYWRIETVDGSQYWYVDKSVRLIHVNSGWVLTVAGTSHIANTSNVNTIAVDPSRGENDKWNVVDASIKIVKSSKCNEYLSEIAKNNRLIEAGAQGYGDLTRKNKDLRRKYNTECYHMSKYSYDKILSPELTKVESQTKIMNSEQETFDNFLNKEETENKRFLEKKQLHNSKKSRLDELLAIRCKPVKVCVDQVGNNMSVNEQCKSLVPLTKNNKVTDSLVKGIKNIRRGSDNINNYDIRSHRDYFKYSKAREISSC